MNAEEAMEVVRGWSGRCWELHSLAERLLKEGRRLAGDQIRGLILNTGLKHAMSCPYDVAEALRLSACGAVYCMVSPGQRQRRSSAFRQGFELIRCHVLITPASARRPEERQPIRIAVVGSIAGSRRVRGAQPAAAPPAFRFCSWISAARCSDSHPDACPDAFRVHLVSAAPRSSDSSRSCVDIYALVVSSSA